MDKIKVMIVDDVQQTRTDIKRLLYFEEDMEVVGEAANGQEALEAVEGIMPEVILMDINMPVMDGIKATEAITLNHPQVSVIIISIQGEQEYLKKAMLAGARDYLVKPLGSDEMASTIRQVHQVGRRRQDFPPLENGFSPGEGFDNGDGGMVKAGCRVVSFFSGKGGTGKTVLASNLAVALARQGQKVALVDLDLQFGDVAMVFNLKETRAISDLVEEEGPLDQELLDRYLVRHISGVYILPAPPLPQEGEKVTLGLVEKVLEILKGSFDYIILDTPPAFTDINLLALDLSRLILVPVRRDVVSVKNVKTTLDIMLSLGYQEKIKVILNQADLNSEIEIDDLEKILEATISHLVVGDEKTVLRSVNQGVPFVLEHKTLAISRDLARLADKAETGFNQRKQKGTRLSLINRIFSI